MYFKPFCKMAIFGHFCILFFFGLSNFRVRQKLSKLSDSVPLSVFYWACFSQAPLKISSRSVMYLSVMMLLLGAIYLNGKSAHFGSITVTFTFPFASIGAFYTYFPIGIIDWMRPLLFNCTLIKCSCWRQFLVCNCFDNCL